MSTASRRLGRGLEALLSQPTGTPQPARTQTLNLHQPDADKPVAELPRVSVYEIDRNPFQPRKEFADSQIRLQFEGAVPAETTPMDLDRPIASPEGTLGDALIEDARRLHYKRALLRCLAIAGWTEARK